MVPSKPPRSAVLESRLNTEIDFRLFYSLNLTSSYGNKEMRIKIITLLEIPLIIIVKLFVGPKAMIYLALTLGQSDKDSAYISSVFLTTL